MRTIYLFIALLLVTPLFAQNTFTISGYVKDAGTGEALFGASVFVKEAKRGAAVNPDGFYTITLPADTYIVSFMFIGFNAQNQKVVLNKNTTLNISLTKQSKDLKKVEVVADKSIDNTQSSQMSSISLDIDEIKKLPTFGGEVDVVKVMTLLPGVQSGGEGNSGFYVRGGGPDQNLILLDGVTVYNPSHLFGFFSSFNGDAVKSAEIIKGGMPAQFGGRLSSVLDIKTKEGDKQKFGVEGGIGLIASRLTVQGPIVKNKLSFIVSGRRTYIDLLTKPFTGKNSNSPLKGSGYNFYDLNAKLHWIVGKKDQIFLSGYYGKDNFTFANKNSSFKARMYWSNATASARWNHVYNQKLVHDLTFFFSDYDFGFTGSQSDFEFKLGSGVRDFGVRLDYKYFPTEKHLIRFGAEWVDHTYRPSTVTFESQAMGNMVLPKNINYHTNEAAIYLSDDWEINKRWKINVGVRASYFAFLGNFTRYVPNQLGQTVDTVTYKPWEKIKDYFRAEPRLSGRFLINENMSLKASYSMNYQYVQLASRSTVSLPLDVWLPATERIKPQFSQQFALGYFWNFKQNMFETSIEGFYKPMRNLVEFQDGADETQSLGNNIDNTLVQGKGESYGAEIFIKKAKGKFNGWVGYTLSWTNRRFPTLNEGKVFPAKFDRRHDLSVVLNYDLNYRWQFSTVFVYSSGNTLTMPEALYFNEGKLVTEFGDRNGYRYPAYHRLDVSVTYVTSKPEKRFKSSINFSIYNTYSRQNPFFIYYTQEGNLNDGNFQLKAKQVSVFPIIPSITWNFKY